MSDAIRTITDIDRANKFGKVLAARFTMYENDRRLTELKWARNARQRLGIYDPDIEAALDPKRSRAYPKLTRVKCVSMLSRLMNLLFQDSDKPWSVEASPVPNLDAQDLDLLLQAVEQKAQAAQQEVTDEQIEQAIRELASKRAERLELEIQDQLRELGGNRTLDYVGLCRKVLQSGIDYGVGILKGPFVEERSQRTWERDKTTQKLQAKTITVRRPRFEFTPVWDYYPDMAALTFAQMDGQFTRKVLPRDKIIALKKRPDFIAAQIDRALELFGDGNYKRRAYETEVRSMGSQLNVTAAERGKFEILVWEGNVNGADLAATGVMVRDEALRKNVRGTIWFIGDIVIKADLDPWTQLSGDKAPKMFHHFVFEEDESTLLGTGLPNIVRDSQMGLCASTRMGLDNASIACGLNLEVNLALLSMNQDVTQNQPNKIWYREDDSPTTLQYPAVREIKMDSRITELKALGDMFLAFADQETFVGAATGGDMQKGPSEPFRSAAGASMIRGEAALPFKDVVRNFDVFNQSVIGSLIEFNRQFNRNPNLRGDFQAVARGATTLLTKEVQGMQLDQLASTLTEEEKMYFDMHKFAKARVKARDLDVLDLIVDDAEASRRETAEQQRREAQEQQQQRVVEAQIREVLSVVLKNIAQAGKNSASAEATTANVVLNALEKGLSPSALASEITRGGAGSGAALAAPGAGGQDNGGAGAAAAPDGEGQAVAAPAGAAEGAPGGGASAGAVAAPA